MKTKSIIITFVLVLLVSFIVILRMTREKTPFTRLVITTNLYGQMESCGCMSAPLGGIARLANAVDLYRRNDIPFYLIDAGNFFLPKSELTDHTRRQFLYKAETLSRMISRLGYTLINLTPSDWRLGREQLNQIEKKQNISIITSNLKMSDHRDSIPFYRKLHAGGHKIGLLGIADWKENRDDSALNTVLDELADCNPIIALNNDPSLRSDSLLAKYPQIQFVVQPAREAFSMQLPEYGDGYILQVIDRTQYLAILDLYFGAEQHWTDAGKALQASTFITGPPEKSMADSLHSVLKESSIFGFFQIPLREQFGESEEINAIIDEYDRNIVNTNLPLFQAAEKIAAGQETEEKCIQCHETQYHFWAESSHAKAYQTLYDRGQQYDLECVGCHTTGLTFNEPGKGLARLNFREDVQCAQCHLNLKAHLKSNGEIIPRMNIAENNCMICHNQTHSPEFNYASYFKKIDCATASTMRVTN